MFNDEPYHLTEAVLNGIKTTTRRIVPDSHIKAYSDYVAAKFKTVLDLPTFLLKFGYAKYTPGEIVAIAQKYAEISADPTMQVEVRSHDKKTCRQEMIGRLTGWKNKMYIAAELMPHQIYIEEVRVEHLQDITLREIELEGIEEITKGQFGVRGCSATNLWPTAKDAFAAIIDGVSKKRIWRKNPYVYVYKFRLVE